MQIVSFGNEAHVQTMFGRVGTGHTSIGNRTRIRAMEIEGTTFGTITIDGKTYEHDVIIRLSARW